MKVLHDGHQIFIMVPEVKRTINMSLGKIFFEELIASSNLNRGNKSQITGEKTNHEIQRVENSFQTKGLNKIIIIKKYSSKTCPHISVFLL